MIGEVDKVVCISLARRPDRLAGFEAEVKRMFRTFQWPFCNPELFAAIDGCTIPVPSWWQSKPGAWGCLRSHVEVIRQAVADNVGTLLILEDDAFFCPDFAERYEAFAAAVPDDWGQVYLGGQFINPELCPPQRISEHVLYPWQVGRTHAYILRRETCAAILRWLSDEDWLRKVALSHIDRIFGWLQAGVAWKTYAPMRWMVGQREGRSDIFGDGGPGSEVDARYFNLDWSALPQPEVANG